ncbi:hypothetical protein HU200_052531 [Digitaria exilis]|uniref:RNase H type-1 domain-containing protein n=1 Tax=Digitaria exilis TaxID=1010633 RepID=A0A835AQV8_9POAL|nr:hypothetical protein HU200_052531 [Digitaria exilis]
MGTGSFGLGFGVERCRQRSMCLSGSCAGMFCQPSIANTGEVWNWTIAARSAMLMWRRVTMLLSSVPLRRGLWEAMRQHWPLPDEVQLKYTGPDWLQLLLDSCSLLQQDLIKLVLWRAWTVHNNLTHQSGPTGILDSVQFLLSLQSALTEIQQRSANGSDKGKGHCSLSGNGGVLKKGKGVPNSAPRWEAPPEGWIKVNVDGSFVPQTGEAGAGIVARTSEGKVLFTVWHEFLICSDAAEAEASACLMGLRLAARWTLGRVILETDCVRIANALQSESNHSELGFIIAEARDHAKMMEDWRVR